MLKAGKRVKERMKLRGRAQVDRFYAQLHRTAGRVKKKCTSQDDRRMTTVAGAPTGAFEEKQAMALAALKNMQLRQAADAAQMPPPATFHDPFGFDADVTMQMEPNRRMISPMVSPNTFSLARPQHVTCNGRAPQSSPKLRAFKSCVHRVVYMPTPKKPTQKNSKQHRDVRAD